jgi:phosphoribosylformylglycinamidine synthase
MAWAAVDEALRNVVAVGADPDQVAILDNFCWGNPNLPDRLGSLVRCALGCYDAALAYGTPFVSGKDSLNNEYLGADGRKHAIPGTLLISALGIVPAARYATTMDLKAAGNLLVLLGTTVDEMGGSLYYALHGALGTQPPQPPANPLGRLRTLHALICAGLVQACHDCSEGGLAVAAAEMAMAGRLGLDLDIDRMPLAGDATGLRPSARLFAESLGRFLLEVRPADLPAVEAALAGQVACAVLGRVEAVPRLHVRAGEVVLCDLDLADLLAAWKQDNTR